jgi:hypothetical protein
MSDKEWERFFELMKKATEEPGLSAAEKGKLVREKAEANGEENTLEEFVSQVGSSDGS